METTKRRHNTCIIQFSKLDNRKNGEEVIYEMTIINNFSKLDKGTNFQILELK